MMLRLHRISGLLISLFFFMWFVTGLVLLYHPYPSVDKKMANEMKESLPDLSQLKLADALPPSLRGVESVRVYQFNGQTLVSVEAQDTSFTHCLDTAEKVRPIVFADIERIARRWCNSSVLRVDTLTERAQWVLYERYTRQLPIYKFSFGDEAQTELFVSGKTGQVLQHTTARQRLWSYLGAIPHKLYFESIRKDVETWKTLLTLGGALCLIAAISGVWVGTRVVLMRWRRKRKLQSPYKSPLLRTHHILGLITGVFLIGWGISGTMSMQKVPHWLIPVKCDKSMRGPDFWAGDTLSLSDMELSLGTIFVKFPGVKEMELKKMGGKTVVTLTENSTVRHLTPDLNPLLHEETDVRKQICRLYGSDEGAEVTLLDEYDEYYLAYDGSLPLPVYRVDINDEDGCRFYVHKYGDEVKWQNHNRMVRKWLFSAFHYLNISWLLQHKWLWTLLLWTLAFAGAAVSLTGFIVSVKRLTRKQTTKENK